MAVLRGSVPVRLPVPRFMLAWGRGGVQVLEHLGPESAENLYSSRAPGNAGKYRSCAVSVWWEGTPHSLLLRRSKQAGLGVLGSRVGGAEPETRGSTGFGTFFWRLKVLKTCTPPARPAAMQGNTDHVLSLYGGQEDYIRYFFGEAIIKQGWGCWAGVQVFGTFGA